MHFQNAPSSRAGMSSEAKRNQGMSSEATRNQDQKQIQAGSLVNALKDDQLLADSFYDDSSQLGLDPDKTLTPTGGQSQATDASIETKVESSRSLGKVLGSEDFSSSGSRGLGAKSSIADISRLSREASVASESFSQQLEDYTEEMQNYHTDPEDVDAHADVELDTSGFKARDEAMDVDQDQERCMDLDDPDPDPDPDLGQSPANPIYVDVDDELFTSTRCRIKVSSPSSRQSGRLQATPSSKDKEHEKKVFPPPSFKTSIASYSPAANPTTAKSPKFKPASPIKPVLASGSPSKGAQTHIPFKAVHSPIRPTVGKPGHAQTPLKHAKLHPQPASAVKAPKPIVMSAAQTSAKSTPVPLKTPVQGTSSKPSSQVESTTSVLGVRGRGILEAIEQGPKLKKRRIVSPGPSAKKAQARTISDPDNPFITAAGAKETPKQREDIHVVVDFGPMTPYVAKLAHGAWWGLAGMFSKGTAELKHVDMTRLSQLKGNNATAAPKVSKVFRSDSFSEDLESLGAPIAGVVFDERVVKDPWNELDEEEAQLAEYPFAGLGLRKPPPVAPDFPDASVALQRSHGMVSFRAKLVNLNASKDASFLSKFKLVLDGAELGPSSNYARRFGSKNFIRVKIADKDWKNDSLGEDILKYFRLPFYIGGYVFRALRAHDRNVFLVRTNEQWPGEELRAIKGTGTDEGLDFLGMMSLVNPMELNEGQSMAKWASRFALGLSTSVPVYQVCPRNMHVNKDIVSAEGSDMTDGYGEVSQEIARVVHRELVPRCYPTCMQMRACGSKGLLGVRDTESESEASMWLRPSQIKSNLHRPLDPSQTIIDFLCSSHSKTPARLGYEWIINLYENGVPKEAFQELIRTASKKRLAPLMAWAESGKPIDTRARILLCVAVYRAGGIAFTKKRRLAVTVGRARGFGDIGERDDEDEEEDEEDGGADAQKSVAWWPDAVSGCPSSLEETVVYMLTSGFCPRTCPILLLKLYEVLKKEVDSALKRCRFEVEMSATAFMIPDPSGLLKEGELFFRSSEANLMRPDGLRVDQIFGVDVLATRSPCKLPTDVRKMRLVDIPQLRKYTNVVIFSTQGSRRPADYLGGGDYDGDKALLLWDPALVVPFRNADLKYADEPQEAKDAFEQSIKVVSEFLEETKDVSREDKIRLIQSYTLSEIVTASKIGIYNQFYLQSLYMTGYNDPETILLAYIFCAGLDGVKNGKTVKKEIASAHQKKYGSTVLKWWKWLDKQKKANSDTNERAHNDKADAKRPASLGPFIMDLLMDMVKKQRDEELTILEKAVNGVKSHTRNTSDEHLKSPWNVQLAHAEELNAKGEGTKLMEMNILKVHVEKCWVKYKEARTPSKNRSPSKGGKPARSFTSLSIETRQDVLRKQSQMFANHPFAGEFRALSEDDVPRLKASYAYIFGQDKSGDAYKNRFCWDVTMRAMCDIKAKALGPTKTLTQDFYEIVVPKDIFT